MDIKNYGLYTDILYLFFFPPKFNNHFLIFRIRILENDQGY